MWNVEHPPALQPFAAQIEHHRLCPHATDEHDKSDAGFALDAEMAARLALRLYSRHVCLPTLMKASTGRVVVSLQRITASA
jgi:hypothetical protein